MAFWLLKSEPDAFSWADQVRNGVEPWTGVRAHEARRHLAAMKNGDRALFYHSNIGREVVASVVVVREAYPDPTAAAGEPWVAVDVRADRPLARPVTLAAIKADPVFADFLLVRRARLSVLPVSEAHWERIVAMGDGFTGPNGAAGPGKGKDARRTTARKGRRADHGHGG